MALLVSQSRRVLSSLPETMRVPSGLNAALVTASPCACIGAPIGWPLLASHCRKRLVDAARDDACAVGTKSHAVHSGSTLIDVRNGSPVLASQSRSVISRLPETT